MDDRPWGELVAEGLRLARAPRGERDPWQLADLALAAGSHASAAKLADELGISRNTMRIYRDVAAAWPPARREPQAPFGAHAVLRAEPARFGLIRPGMTAHQARRARGLPTEADARRAAPARSRRRRKRASPWLRMQAAEPRHDFWRAIAGAQIHMQRALDIRRSRATWTDEDQELLEEGLAIVSHFVSALAGTESVMVDRAIRKLLATHEGEDE